MTKNQETTKSRKIIPIPKIVLRINIQRQTKAKISRVMLNSSAGMNNSKLKIHLLLLPLSHSSEKNTSLTVLFFHF
jgi:hypothetical protein